MYRKPSICPLTSMSHALKSICAFPLIIPTKLLRGQCRRCAIRIYIILQFREKVCDDVRRFAVVNRRAARIACKTDAVACGFCPSDSILEQRHFPSQKVFEGGIPIANNYRARLRIGFAEYAHAAFAYAPAFHLYCGDILRSP